MFDKLSNTLAVFTALQAIYMILSFNGIFESEIMKFDLYHEDIILVMHMMTWFIVRAIENKNFSLKIDIEE